MSDGLASTGALWSDIYGYFGKLARYLKGDPAPHLEQSIQEHAEGAGFFFSKEWLELLKNKEKETWASLLATASKNAAPDDYSILQDLSPYKGKLLAYRNISRGETRLDEQSLRGYLDRCVKAQGLSVPERGTQFLAFDEPDPLIFEIINFPAR